MYLAIHIACHFVTLALFAFILWKIKNTILRFLGAALSWIIGFLLAQQAGRAEAARLFIEASPEDLRTEDFIMTIPDGPNITAGWILTGWLPLLLAYFIIKRRLRSDQNKKDFH